MSCMHCAIASVVLSACTKSHAHSTFKSLHTAGKELAEVRGQMEPSSAICHALPTVVL
ncbi:hypothetical protein BDR04DRAFT_1092856 [Suillus decipiens]|nr:hypothetical protein BDR04DRAFT_1092856 [Suillus decipiens]